MPNKDRQKRSVRKARAAERKELEAKRTASAPASASASKKAAVVQAKAEKKAPAKKKGRIATWFAGVKSEMKRVTWPTKLELKNYAVAVVCMLVFFGIAVWLIDTGVVAGLVSYSGLRG
ncbi:preprotein translocase subunit SecE [Olsenella uli]|uniref:preprotein translocase subunit SecE n=1 Tax=Olsenella uli TaxID=133926 RepID=UPI0012ABF201|nr:preprotein translocase subunit SecE [Olsenella uli]